MKTFIFWFINYPIILTIGFNYCKADPFTTKIEELISVFSRLDLYKSSPKEISNRYSEFQYKLVYQKVFESFGVYWDDQFRVGVAIYRQPNSLSKKIVYAFHPLLENEFFLESNNEILKEPLLRMTERMGEDAPLVVSISVRLPRVIEKILGNIPIWAFSGPRTLLLNAGTLPMFLGTTKKKGKNGLMYKIENDIIGGELGLKELGG